MTSIAMVGDIFLQNTLPQTSDFQEVANILTSADIAFGNLETPVSERGVPVEKWMNMRMSPDLLSDVAAMGIDIVTLANNHLMDYGEDAFFDTLSYLPQHNIQHVGGGSNLDEAWQPALITVDNMRIGFVAGTSTLGPGMAADESRAGVAPIHVSESYNIDFAASMEQPGSAPYVFTRAWQEDVDRAIQAIQEASAQSDFVVVAMHWGVPPAWRTRFQDGLADYQIEVGHTLIEAGADVIVGHHPHSLQAVEVFQGKPIFYSVGNFLFHNNTSPIQRTIINRNAPYTLAIHRDHIWSEAVVVYATIHENQSVEYSLYPILLDADGNPTRLYGDDATTLIGRLADMSPDATIESRNDVGYLKLA